MKIDNYFTQYKVMLEEERYQSLEDLTASELHFSKVIATRYNQETFVYLWCQPNKIGCVIPEYRQTEVTEEVYQFQSKKELIAFLKSHFNSLGF